MISQKYQNLCFVYHTPFWVADGKFVTSHVALGKYVDSLAPYFTKIYLGVPKPGINDQAMYELKSGNYELLELPHFHNISGFWLRFLIYYWQLIQSAKYWDILNIRIPTQLAFPAYLAAKIHKKPIFNVIVGEFFDYNSRAKYPYFKQKLVNIDSRIQDFSSSIIVKSCLNFTNGDELYQKYRSNKNNVVLTRSSTVNDEDLIDPSMRSGLNDPIRIITVAVISPGKGISLIPDVINYLLQSGINLEWIIVGKIGGSSGQKEFHKTLAKATKHNIIQYMKFPGYKSWQELRQLYKESDIFVLPTYAEGVPRVLLEAQAAGLPVVITSVGGIPGAISNNENGLLVPPGEPEKMAKAISELIQDKVLYQKLVMNGIQTAKEHSLESETKKMLKQVYEYYDF